MLTVGRLKEILNQYSDDMPVVVNCATGHDYQDAEVSEQRIVKDSNCNYVYEELSPWESPSESLGRDVYHALLIS